MQHTILSPLSPSDRLGHAPKYALSCATHGATLKRVWLWGARVDGGGSRKGAVISLNHGLSNTKSAIIIMLTSRE